ncbi:MAG: hypothetical protein DWQ09_04560 [Proteobacteria bacterium]|nr:MAG: hypothetical protein DWQ09_04560 [Pseudomonadota bacterium]QKK11250.1 MAG: hypothetical protein HND59_06215 [Pseudomonadota bacterium]
MYNADLAFDKAPPLDTPFRFFLTAPLFGMAAALLLLWAGPDALATRWSPTLLALTHLITLGVLVMVMVGAVIQMVAVIAGSPAARPRLLGGIVHGALIIGVAGLGIGLLGLGSGWMLVAVIFLGLGITGFVVIALQTLLRAPRAHDTVLGMELAVIALALTLGLGLVLAFGHALEDVPLYRFPLTDAHLGWGIAGWIGLLLVGVSFQVVPMFQITPNYPDWMRRWLIKVIFAGLLTWSVGDLLAFWWNPGWVWVGRIGGVVLLGAFAVFAIVTLRLQSQRRRRLADVTTDFWRVGMVCAVLSGLVWLVAQLVPQFAHYRGYPLLLGSLLLGGFALSVVNGMLYKIVPFLVWFHLQNEMLSATNVTLVRVPNMKQIVPDLWARRQLRVHQVAMVLLLGAIVYPVFLTHLSAVAFFISFALLLWNIVGASFTYRKHHLRMTRPAVAPPVETTSPSAHR